MSDVSAGRDFYNIFLAGPPSGHDAPSVTSRLETMRFGLGQLWHVFNADRLLLIFGLVAGAALSAAVGIFAYMTFQLGTASSLSVSAVPFGVTVIFTGTRAIKNAARWRRFDEWVAWYVQARERPVDELEDSEQWDEFRAFKSQYDRS